MTIILLQFVALANTGPFDKLVVFIAGGSAYASIAQVSHPLGPFLGFIPVAVALLAYLAIKKRWNSFFSAVCRA